MRFIPSLGIAQRAAKESVDSGAVDKVAEEIAKAARAVAPVDTGAYRDSIHVEDGAVVADVAHAAAVEAGTADTPAFSPLRRGAETVVGTNNLKRRDI